MLTYVWVLLGMPLNTPCQEVQVHSTTLIPPFFLVKDRGMV